MRSPSPRRLAAGSLHMQQRPPRLKSSSLLLFLSLLLSAPIFSLLLSVAPNVLQCCDQCCEINWNSLFVWRELNWYNFLLRQMCAGKPFVLKIHHSTVAFDFTLNDNNMTSIKNINSKNGFQNQKTPKYTVYCIREWCAMVSIQLGRYQ